ncbi:MAG: MerR family transcriptional regulator [Roseburia sp.]|nr:MerR family transcriptional regulator [Roseburia sp.]
MKKEKFPIGDTSKMFGISANTLRYYEKMGILHSIRDENNNYRYYDLAGITTLHSVIFLRSLGLPIEKIQNYFIDSDVAALKEGIAQTKTELKDQITELQKKLRYLTYLSEEISNIEAHLSQICIKESPKWYIAALADELDIKNYISENIDTYNKFSCFTYATFIMKSGSLLNRSYDYSGYGVIFEPLAGNDIPNYPVIEPRKCVYCPFVGNEQEILDHYNIINDWIKERHLEVSGDVIERLIMSSAEKLFIEIWIPIK